MNDKVNKGLADKTIEDAVTQGMRLGVDLMISGIEEHTNGFKGWYNGHDIHKLLTKIKIKFEAGQ